jgi:MYXO-CTERM domain-containing protein
VAYSLSGTVSPVPEPRFYAGFLGLLMIGTGLVIRRRQRAQ